MKMMNSRKSTILRWAPFVVALCASTSTFAQRGLKNIPPPDLEKELDSFQVVDGFEISLFAADPLINKPIQINFDTAGRLWVASSSLYPHLKPGDVPEDRILVLEDRDGDGRAETSTVFAEGFLMPTAVLPGNGGAYVANSTELLFLKDTDGDGKADYRRVMLSGFGTEDTHHIIHTLRWGHDGFVYFNQSIYIHSHVETPHGVRRLNAGGIWQFRPDTLELDVFVYGMVNGWGQTFDDWGQHFGTDGAYGEGVIYFLPGASYVTAKTGAPIFHGLNRGTPKYCGADFVSGSHLPDDWQGSFITNDFRAHRVVRYTLSEEGSGYTAKLMPDVIRSKHIAFRPVDVKLGPDGAIYFADWYNPIIQHGEVSFRDPRRNHVNGRVWRLTAKGRPLVERPKIAGESLSTLFEHLKSGEGWTRDFAKQEIREHPAGKVVAELDAWIAGLDANDPKFEHQILEGLWVKLGVRKPDRALLERLLNAKEPRARAAAVRVLAYWLPSIPNALELLATSVADDFPRVRLESVRALGRVRDPRAIELAASVLDRPMDKFLDYALGTTVRDLRDIWIAALHRGEIDFGGSARQLEFALKAAGSPNVVGPILDLLEKGGLPKVRRAALLTVVAALGNAEQAAFAFAGAHTLAEEAGAGEAGAGDLALDVLRTVRISYETRKLAAPKGASVDGLLAHADDRIAATACGLVALWKAAGGAKKLADLARSEPLSITVRRAALDGLVASGRGRARDLVADIATSGTSKRDLRHDAVAALAALDAKAAAKLAVAVATEDPVPAASSFERIVDAFLRRKDGPVALAPSSRGRRSAPSSHESACDRRVRFRPRETLSSRPLPRPVDSIPTLRTRGRACSRPSRRRSPTEPSRAARRSSDVRSFVVFTAMPSRAPEAPSVPTSRRSERARKSTTRSTPCSIHPRRSRRVTTV